MTLTRLDLGGRKIADNKGSAGIVAARRRFLEFFPDGFDDNTYIDWERDYKWRAHESWKRVLNSAEFRSLLRDKQYSEIANRALKIESKTNLLFSFEKIALRDALRSPGAAKVFATTLYDLLHGTGPIATRFEKWAQAVEKLPRFQTRVLTWPVVTVFAFIAQPKKHIFFKPNMTRAAAERCGIAFDYRSRPNWETYRQLLKFAKTVRNDIQDLNPKDMIDIQSFLWTIGSTEYDRMVG